MRGKPVKDIDFEQLASRTREYSGADLKAVVDQAVEAKLREAMRVGVPQPLTTRDLANAAGTVKPSTREWFARRGITPFTPIRVVFTTTCSGT